MFHTQLAHARSVDSLDDNHTRIDEKYLLLMSRGALYAIEVTCVREVHALPSLKTLPQAPHFVAGVVNVRGEVLPVVDLAARLGQVSRTPRLSDGLVVLQTPLRRVALWVEEVRDIAAFANDQIEDAPFASASSLVSHLTHCDGEVVFLLQASRLLEAEIEEKIEVDANHIEAEAVLSGDQNDVADAVFQARAQRLALVSAEVSAEVSSPGALSLGAKATIAVARVVIGGEERGVVLTQVREFCALENFAPIPCCPPHIVGQMNLRGEVVTLLDVAPRLGLRSSSRAKTAGQVVVVKTRNANEEAGLVGIVIESVSDVLSLREHEMRAVPTSSRATDKMCCAILHDERWIPVLDLPAILSDADLEVDETV